MKKIIFVFAVIMMFAACVKEENDVVSSSDKHHVVFDLDGDFTVDSEQLDAKSGITTDSSHVHSLWIFDYKEGVLEQQVMKQISDADFGRPELSLSAGTHHIYFVASSGSGVSWSTHHHLVMFNRVGDTFWQDHEINVSSLTPRHVNVTLDRVVTKLKCTFTDTMRSNVATINVIPHMWYFGIDYFTGKASETLGARTDTTLVWKASSYGYDRPNITITLYGFSPDNDIEWTDDIYINAKTSEGSVIGSVGITDVPFKTNRMVSLSGRLFSTGDSATIFLNSTWDSVYTGTF